MPWRRSGPSAFSAVDFMKLVLAIHSLGGGGAERSLSMLANLLSEAGHRVTVVTLAGIDEDVFPLDSDITRVGLDVMHDSTGAFDAVRWNVQRLRALRRAIRAAEPDCVISFTEKMNVLVLLATPRLQIPVVISERVDLRRHRIGRAWSLLRRFAYPRADGLVVLTHSVRRYCQKLVGERPVRVIPNAARIPEPQLARRTDGPRSSRSDAGRERHGPELAPGRDAATRIVAMGRLHPQKGFDLLIEAFARLAPRHSRARLDIYGEGGERTSLQRRIDALDLGGRVRLAGWTSDPAAAFRGADLFVMSSRYEGFGNVLTEAMACGLPAVSFNCDSGPRDIIRHGVDGLLVPAEDAPALAAQMDRVLSDEPLRRRLAERAPEVLERFHVERFLRQWEMAILEAVSASKPRMQQHPIPRFKLASTTSNEMAVFGGFP